MCYYKNSISSISVLIKIHDLLKKKNVLHVLAGVPQKLVCFGVMQVDTVVSDTA